MRLLSALVLFLIVLASVRETHAAERPNVMVILCDDLGYGDLGCFGNETIQTPHLDHLASQGIRLTDCYSSSPLCSPARAGLMIGRTPSRAGIYSWIAAGNPMYLKSDETTIATILKQNGYDTCHVGKWHLNGLFNDPQQTQPGDHGFEHWFSTQNNAGPTHRNPNNFVRNGSEVGPLTGFSCQLVAEEAINWLTARNSENPFFMYVCFHEPHEPVDSPEELVSSYPDAVKRGEALYYANVSNMDRAVGRLMETLQSLGIEEDTLVIFTSDNGPETLDRYPGAWRSHGSPGPLRGMKLHLYEGGIRVPGMIRWTGKIEPGQVCDEPVCGVDILPTICEVAGVEVPHEKVLDGTSVTPIFAGGEVKREKPLFWHYYGGTGNRQVALRDGKWKVVARWDGPSDYATGGSLKEGVVPQLKKSKLEQFELYNIAVDISETHDLSEENPQVLDRLSKLAQRTYREVIEEGPYWFDDQE